MKSAHKLKSKRTYSNRIQKELGLLLSLTLVEVGPRIWSPVSTWQILLVTHSFDEAISHLGLTDVLFRWSWVLSEESPAAANSAVSQKEEEFFG